MAHVVTFFKNCLRTRPHTQAKLGQITQFNVATWRCLRSVCFTQQEFPHLCWYKLVWFSYKIQTISKGFFWIGYERDCSKHEADHDAKMLQSTAWLMTILQAKNITVGIVASWSRRGPDLEPFIPGEISYYTHSTVITQNCRWKYLLPTTTSKIAIRHHH